MFLCFDFRKYWDLKKSSLNLTNLKNIEFIFFKKRLKDDIVEDIFFFCFEQKKMLILFSSNSWYLSYGILDNKWEVQTLTLKEEFYSSYTAPRVG